MDFEFRASLYLEEIRCRHLREMDKLNERYLPFDAEYFERVFKRMATDWSNGLSEVGELGDTRFFCEIENYLNTLGEFVRPKALEFVVIRYGFPYSPINEL